jgi:DNA-binding MarR family transcriptional regulator
VTSTARPSRAQLALFADVILDLAHRLDIKNGELKGVVPLTGTEIAVIRRIHSHPRSTPSQIAEATGLHRSNVSTAIRSLVAGGLVIREEQAGNARSVELVPTQRASDSVDRINAYWASLLQQVPADLLKDGVNATSTLADIADSIDRS